MSAEDRQTKRDGRATQVAADAVANARLIDRRGRSVLEGAARANSRVGFDRLDVTAILEGTGIPEASFFEFFDDATECVLTAQLHAFSILRAEIDAATFQPFSSWMAQLLAGVGAGLEFAAESPEQARLLLIPEVIPELGGARATTNAYLASLLRTGRAHFDCEPPEATELTYVNGALTIVEERLDRDTQAQLPGLREDLAVLLSMPITGLGLKATQAAIQEASLA